MGTHYCHFSAEERGVIMAMCNEGRSVRAIAAALGRASTVTVGLRRQSRQSTRSSLASSIKRNA